MNKRTEERRRRRKRKSCHNRTRLLIFCIVLIIVSIVCFIESFYIETSNELQQNNSSEAKGKAIEVEAIAESNLDVQENEVEQTKQSLIEISDDDAYLLAKIAMAEAEGQSTEAKALVMLTVLNRTLDDGFPDTVHDVIFQQSKSGVYQFSPIIPGGRWWTTEPNNDCDKALDLIKQGYNESQGSLYFECCSSRDNWHSRNLNYLFEVDSIRFYK